MLQSLCTGEAGSGRGVQDSREEVGCSIWGCAAGSDLVQQGVLHRHTVLLNSLYSFHLQKKSHSVMTHCH